MRDAPIIVGGCHRSGTSLVRRILDAHPRIHCPPEIKFLIDFHGDYRQDPHAHARFFRTAGAVASRDRLFDVFGAAFIRLHREAASEAGKPRWADKNPENVLYLDDWERLLGDGWTLVNVIRDPRDAIASMREAGFPLEGVDGELDARIDHWIRCAATARAFARKHPERFVEVRYERLVARPGAAIRDLMETLGEDFAPAQLGAGEAPSSPAHLEDPKAGGRRVIDAGGVGRWRRDLDPADAQHVAVRVRRAMGRVHPELPPSKARKRTWKLQERQQETDNSR